MVTKNGLVNRLFAGKGMLYLVLVFCLFALSVQQLVPVLKPEVAKAATSSTINFQARLLTSSGNTVPDGNYHVEFKLHDDLSAGGGSQGACSGSCLWRETRTTGNLVRVVNGYLTVNLGSVTAFGSSIEWDQEHWLSLNIGGNGGGASWDGEMSPRLKFTATPYAFEAGQLTKQDGANRATLAFDTLTGSRSILLPDESGTLCIQGSANCGFVDSSDLTLQGAYNGGNTLTTTDGNDIDITLANTTNAANFTIDIATGSTGELKVQSNGTDVLQIGSAGQLQLDVQGSSGGILLGGDANLYRSAASTLKTVGDLHIQTPDDVDVSRLQSASDGGNPSSATFASTPNEGNLLVATSFARTGTSIGAISGTGWTLRIDRDTEFGDINHRRSIKIWTKIAESSEPTNVQVDGTDNLLSIEEYAGNSGEQFSFVDAASNDNGATSDSMSIATGTTGSTSGDVLVIGVAAARLANAAYPDFDFSSLDLEDKSRINEGGVGRLIETAYVENSTDGTKSSTAGSVNNNNTGLSAAILVFGTYDDTLKVERADGTDVLQIGSSGQLRLNVQGSSGGILLGEDTNLYRSAANELTTDDSLVVVGDFTNTGQALFQNAADSTTAFQIQNSLGTSNLFVADTENTRIGIGKASPSQTLDVAGTVQIAATNTSAFQIRNGGSQQIVNVDTTNMLFNLNRSNSATALSASDSMALRLQASYWDGAANVNETLTILNDGDNTAQNTSLVIRNNSDTKIFGLTNSGAALFQNAADSTTAFQIQDQAGTSNLFIADTENSRIGIGTDSPAVRLHLVAPSGNTEDLFAAYNGSTLRTRLKPTGGQSWYLNTGAAESGSIHFTTPNTRPSIQFEDTDGNGIGRIRLITTSGGLGFCSDSDSGCGTDDQFELSNTGQALFQNTSNSPTAFRIQDVGGNNLFLVDTDNDEVEVQGGIWVNGDVSIDSDITVFTDSTTGPNDKVFGTLTHADSFERLRIYGDGLMEWGDGTSARDTNLYRQAAGVLQTDGNLIVEGASTGWNAAAATLFVGMDSGTSRSINAAGSINASGADYAEYIPWSGAKPATGSVVEYNGSAYVVSSKETAAFVGNDKFSNENSILVTFAGQVPVRVTGPVEVGDLLVDNGDGTARAVSPSGATVSDYLGKLGIAQESGSGGTVLAAIGTTSANVALQTGSGGIGSSGDFSSINVSGAADVGTLEVTGTATIATLNVLGNATFAGNITVEGHFIAKGDDPTLETMESLGGGLATVDGNDTAGTITIQTGTNPVDGELLKVLFNKQYGNPPRVILSPANGHGADLKIFRAGTTNEHFILKSTNEPAANTTYKYDYFIIQSE
jgi:hypothetical protein